jgi:hypothetical protein
MSSLQSSKSGERFGRAISQIEMRVAGRSALFVDRSIVSDSSSEGEHRAALLNDNNSERSYTTFDWPHPALKPAIDARLINDCSWPDAAFEASLALTFSAVDLASTRNPG